MKGDPFGLLFESLNEFYDDNKIYFDTSDVSLANSFEGTNNRHHNSV